MNADLAAVVTSVVFGCSSQRLHLSGHEVAKLVDHGDGVFHKPSQKKHATCRLQLHSGSISTASLGMFQRLSRSSLSSTISINKQQRISSST
ncbi:hypothetical protein Q1695_008856 [Nippostrongylus brasiliensis]|nr:hypothetical protein Q1695_008856 [Nippostrongylus brasiliensis]